MDDREGNSVAGTPSQSPQLDCSNNNSRGAASSRPGSRAGSVVSDSGNGASLLLRTGKGSPTGQDAERSSTPKTVLPPIGASLAGCSAESGGETSPLSHPSTGTKTPEPASESVMDKTPGTGDSVPQIVRSFRRETTPESPSSSSGYKRSVSFVTEQRTSYDGREVSLHTLETQTDWDWVEDAILDESVRILEARPQPPVHVGESEDSDKTDGRENSSELLQQSLREAELDGFEQSEEEGPTPYPYRNDQYGVPILDLSSDSEDSSDEDTRKSKPNEDKLLPSVGPPQILQYIRESEKGELSSMNVQVGDLDTMGYAQDEQGKVHGYFSGTCEFCLKPILPFPTPEQQQQQPPEELFCCEEYRRFIEFTIEEDSIGPPSQSLIDVKPHPHFGSKQARKMAQQKAQQRMRERELLRQQQNMVMQNQTYFQKPRQPKTPGGASPAGQIKDGQRSAKGVFGGSELGSERPAMAALNFFAPDQKGMPLVTTAADGDTTDHPDRVAAPPSTSIRDRSVARQMKTINYQLSSQRCLEEGWTVRPPSPLMVNETDDVFIPEGLDVAFAATGKVRRRELIQKFYEDGQPFITIFPDGSGNVFYSSGKVAVVISSTGPGQFMYVILDDAVEPSSENPMGCPPQVLGVFRSDGKASCCYTNGNIRLFLDQYGGIELDRIGAKKRRWTWKDTETHVHAPPFQPVCFALSIHIAIRVMSQENISLTFRCGSRSCRFPVGSKLKLVAPENIPPKEIDDNILFINEMKVNTDSLLNKISNLLRFPNSPKVEKMLPPLHITSKIHKNQKLRVEQGAALAAAKAKASKPRPIRAVVVS